MERREGVEKPRRAVKEGRKGIPQNKRIMTEKGEGELLCPPLFYWMVLFCPWHMYSVPSPRPSLQGAVRRSSLVPCLFCSCEDFRSDPRNYVRNSDVLASTCNPNSGETVRQNPGAHQSSSLASVVSSEPMRNHVSKSKVYGT